MARTETMVLLELWEHLVRMEDLVKREMLALQEDPVILVTMEWLDTQDPQGQKDPLVQPVSEDSEELLVLLEELDPVE